MKRSKFWFRVGIVTTVIFILIIVGIFVERFNETPKQNSKADQQTISKQDSSKKKEEVTYPLKVTFVKEPSLDVLSAYLVDAESNKILYSKKPDATFFPASTTKLMTVLVALDYYKPGEIIEVPKIFVEGTKLGLVPKAQFSLEELVKAALIASANDAAEVIAQGGKINYEQFIDSMNKKAQHLGMKDTHFTNPTGLHDQNHYSTARDLVILAREAMKNKLISTVVSQKKATVASVDGTYTYKVVNTNELLGKLGVNGIKTGTTKEAGQVLIISSGSGKKHIIGTVLSSKDRFSDMKKLISYVFANYSWDVR